MLSQTRCWHILSKLSLRRCWEECIYQIGHRARSHIFLCVVGFLSWWLVGTYIVWCRVVSKGNEIFLIINKGPSRIHQIFLLAGFLTSQLLSKGVIIHQETFEYPTLQALIVASPSTTTFVKRLIYVCKLSFFPWVIPLSITFGVGFFFWEVKWSLKFSHKSVYESMFPWGIGLNQIILGLVKDSAKSFHYATLSTW